MASTYVQIIAHMQLCTYTELGLDLDLDYRMGSCPSGRMSKPTNLKLMVYSSSKMNLTPTGHGLPPLGTLCAYITHPYGVLEHLAPAIYNYYV